MGALTAHTPKPMLMVGGKNLIEHKFDVLPDTIDEVVLIVGYLGNVIQEYFGSEYKGKRILYVEQEKPAGTADALWQAKDILHDRFLVLNGDDIYASADINALTQADGWAVLGLTVDALGSAGKVVTDPEGVVTDIIEASHHGGGGGVLNTGAFALDAKLFDYPLIPKAPGSTEYGLPQTILGSGHPLKLVLGTQWIVITAPEDLARAEEILETT